MENDRAELLRRIENLRASAALLRMPDEVDRLLRRLEALEKDLADPAHLPDALPHAPPRRG